MKAYHEQEITQIGQLIPKFNLGNIYSTGGVRDLLGMDDLLRILVRHITGDWGDLDEHDRHENELAIQYGDRRILSAYHINDTKVWIITEADRSVTTILLPEEY